MRRLRVAAVVIVALVLLILVGMLLFKHFITDQIRDKDGMVNPNYIMDTDSNPVAEPTEDEAP